MKSNQLSNYDLSLALDASQLSIVAYEDNLSLSQLWGWVPLKRKSNVEFPVDIDSSGGLTLDNGFEERAGRANLNTA